MTTEYGLNSAWLSGPGGALDASSAGRLATRDHPGLPYSETRRSAECLRSQSCRQAGHPRPTRVILGDLRLNRASELSSLYLRYSRVFFRGCMQHLWSVSKLCLVDVSTLWKWANNITPPPQSVMIDPITRNHLQRIKNWFLSDENRGYLILYISACILSELLLRAVSGKFRNLTRGSLVDVCRSSGAYFLLDAMSKQSQGCWWGKKDAN